MVFVLDLCWILIFGLCLVVLDFFIFGLCLGFVLFYRNKFFFKNFFRKKNFKQYLICLLFSYYCLTNNA